MKRKIPLKNAPQKEILSRRQFCLAAAGAALVLEELVVGLGRKYFFSDNTKNDKPVYHLSKSNILNYLFDIQTQYLKFDSSKIAAAKTKVDRIYSQVCKKLNDTDIKKFFIAAHHAIQDNGIVYQKDAPFVDGLLNGKLDCDGLSYLYIGLGQELNLPVTGIQLPNHFAVHASGINFETTLLNAEKCFITNEDYIKLLYLFS